jgi:hypothetical protein
VGAGIFCSFGIDCCLQRDVDVEGFKAWLNYQNARPGRDCRTVAGGFIKSDERRVRCGA